MSIITNAESPGDDRQSLPAFRGRICGNGREFADSKSATRISVSPLMVDRINYTQRINHRSHYFEFELTPRDPILWEAPRRLIMME